jgi:(+)-trans-carveol dehydrogenase/(-)-trans-carveol dehydrogenase
MGRLEGKVALITGAARGQGRSHALRLAEEGAKIAALDICEPIPSLPYSTATSADLEETVGLVESSGGTIIGRKADVRCLRELEAVVDQCLAAFGHLDVVSVNAAIAPQSRAPWEVTEDEWRDVIDVNLTGAWNTLRATVPPMIAAGRGGSVVVTGSTAALTAPAGIAAYVASKSGLAGLARSFARELAPHFIRVNLLLPTTVRTDMVLNEAVYRIFRPDLAHPTLDDVVDAMRSTQLLPIPWVESIDVSNALVFLASDESRYLTGVELPVDGGAAIR